MKAQVVYTGAEAGVLELTESDWSVITSGRIFGYFDTPSVCCLEPEFDVQLFAGGQGEGWMAWPVMIDDPNPVLAVGMNRDGTGGIFFAITSQ